MKVEKKRYKVRLFDDEYTILSDDMHEHIVVAAQHVDRRMHEMARNQPALDTKKMALLVALQLASDVVVLEKKDATRAQEHQELAQKVQQGLDSL